MKADDTMPLQRNAQGYFDIYIAHARVSVDNSIAKEIYCLLYAEGHSVLLDSTDPFCGDWATEARQNIARSKCVLLVLTRDAADRLKRTGAEESHLRAELKTAKLLGVAIIPIRQPADIVGEGSGPLGLWDSDDMLYMDDDDGRRKWSWKSFLCDKQTIFGATYGEIVAKLQRGALKNMEPERERKAREDAERKAREDAERKTREDAERRLKLWVIVVGLVAFASGVAVGWMYWSLPCSIVHPPEPDPAHTSISAHEAELNISGGGVVMVRSNASGAKTLNLRHDQRILWTAMATQDGLYELDLRYSNDGSADIICVIVDGRELAPFETKVTGTFGNGWNQFLSATLPVGALPKGKHDIVLSVEKADELGVEIDTMELRVISGGQESRASEGSRFDSSTSTKSDVLKTAIAASVGSSNTASMNGEPGGAENGAPVVSIVQSRSIGDHTSTTAVHANRPVLISNAPVLPPLILPRNEAEATVPGNGTITMRDRASGKTTVRLKGGKSINIPVKVDRLGMYEVVVQYSKDTNDGPLDGVVISVDNEVKAQFQAMKTGEYGEGWNSFAVVTNAIGSLSIWDHSVRLVVDQADKEGVEIDFMQLKTAEGNAVQ